MPVYVARVLSNGRVTLPANLREKLGLTGGHLVKFTVTEDSMIISKMPTALDPEQDSMPAPRRGQGGHLKLELP